MTRVIISSVLLVLLPVWPARERAGGLRLTIRPATARVFIDGQAADAARSFTLAPGAHLVRLVGGSRDQESVFPVDIARGQTRIVVVDLPWAKSRPQR